MTSVAIAPSRRATLFTGRLPTTIIDALSCSAFSTSDFVGSVPPSAYVAVGTGDQHSIAAQDGCHGVEIGCNLFGSQEVLDLHVTNVGGDVPLRIAADIRGTIFIAISAASAASVARRTVYCGALVIANTARLAPVAATTSVRSSIPPTIGTPMNHRPWWSGSSSSTATGLNLARGLCSMSDTMPAPESPDPMTTTPSPS